MFDPPFRIFLQYSMAAPLIVLLDLVSHQSRPASINGGGGIVMPGLTSVLKAAIATPHLVVVRPEPPSIRSVNGLPNLYNITRTHHAYAS